MSNVGLGETEYNSKIAVRVRFGQKILASDLQLVTATSSETFGGWENENGTIIYSQNDFEINLCNLVASKSLLCA